MFYVELAIRFVGFRWTRDVYRKHANQSCILRFEYIMRNGDGKE